MPTRAVVLVAIALACFAGNSLLCRLALAGRAIDAPSFTFVRIAAGALVLAVLSRGRGEPSRRRCSELTVPILAAVGGMVWLDETLTARFVAATVLVVGGVSLAIRESRRKAA